MQWITYMVRGHWRKTPSGNRIWIEPYAVTYLRKDRSEDASET